jgi:hypothetical protein
MCWLLLMDQILVKYVSIGLKIEYYHTRYLKVGSSDFLIYSLMYQWFFIWYLKFTTSYLNKVNRFLNETKIWYYGYNELVYFWNKILYDKSYNSNLKKLSSSLPDNLKKPPGPLISLSTLVIRNTSGIAGITLQFTKKLPNPSQWPHSTKRSSGHGEKLT